MSKIKQIISIIVIVCISIYGMGFSFASEAASDNTEIFVAVDGNDSNSGGIDSPFATLEKARDTIRDIKTSKGLPQGGIKVYMRGGTYNIGKSFILEEQDSGTETSPIIYRNYNNEKVRLVGGTCIAPEKLKPVLDKSALSRFSSDVRSKIVQANLNEAGIKDIKKRLENENGNPVEVFASGKSMKIARYPNEGYVLTGQIIEVGDVPRNWMDDIKGQPNWVPPEKRNDPPKGPTFAFEGERPFSWKNDGDIKMYGYWYWDWATSEMTIEQIDKENRTIKASPPNAYGIKSQQRYYYYNIMEELDAPGEYYIDKTKGILYFYPFEHTENSEIIVSLLPDSMVKMNNVSNVKLYGLTIEGSRGNGVEIAGGSNNLVSNCVLRYLGNQAVIIGDTNLLNVTPKVSGGINNGVINCEIYETGKGGLTISGGDRYTLTPAGNYAINNRLYRTNRNYTTAVGISLFGVGNTVSYNEISDIPYTAIRFHGNDLIIEYNNIHNVVNSTQDAGAIAGGRNLTVRGNIIRNNYFHDIRAMAGAGDHMVFSIYLDDLNCGTTIIGNVFENVDIGVMINGGRDNIIENNAFVNVKGKSVIVSTTGFMNMAQSHWETTFFNLYNMGTKDLQVPYNKAPYTKYPNLSNIIEDEPKYPKYNSVTNNIFYNAGDVWIYNRGTETNPELTEDDVYKRNNLKGNLVTNINPFIDIENHNYSIQENTEATKKLPQFKPLSISKAGNQDKHIEKMFENSVALYVGGAYAYTKEGIKPIDINNKRVTPVIIDGRTLVPVRFIAENFGAKVDWNADNATIHINYIDKTIEMKLNSRIITANGSKTEIDVAAQSIDGRTFIPLRALAETMGKSVFWDNRGLIVISEKADTLSSQEEKTIVDELIRRLLYY